MQNWRGTAVAVAAITAVLVGAGSFSVAQGTGEGLIKYRQSVMASNSGHVGAIARIVRGEAEHGEHLAAHAQALNDLANMIPDAFEESAEGAENRALPEIWSDWDGFVAKAEALQTATVALVAAVESGDSEAIGAAFGPVGAACGGCHEVYRAQ